MSDERNPSTGGLDFSSLAGMAVATGGGIAGAIEKIEQLVEGKVATVAHGGRIYSVRDLKPLDPPLPAPLQVSTLSAITSYLRSTPDELNLDELVLVVEGNTKVSLYSKLREVDQKRAAYMTANAILPKSSHAFDTFVSVEEFLVWLATGFAPSAHRELLTKMLSHIDTEDTATIQDNGFSQVVTVRTGVARVENVAMPNPVKLAPYVSFPEIAPPEQDFLIRMRGKGKDVAVRLIPVGALNWALLLRDRIGSWLQNDLENGNPKATVPVLW